MLTIKPSNNQLFCKPETPESKTNSGFLLLEKSKERPQTAKVINVGAGVEDFSSKDTIVYKPYATTEIKLEGEDYFLIAQEDVLGTVV